MRLETKELRLALRERFPGDLLYMPIHLDDSRNARPIAQLTLHPQIPAFIASTEPRSLTRRNSGLHLKGILHHDLKTQKLEN